MLLKVTKGIRPKNTKQTKHCAKLLFGNEFMIQSF